MHGVLDGCVRRGFYRLGLLLLFLGLLAAIVNVAIDPDWATRMRDAAHWLILFAAASVAIAIYHIHITRFELESAIAADDHPDVTQYLVNECPKRFQDEESEMID
jgi:hypothetical protein